MLLYLVLQITINGNLNSPIWEPIPKQVNFWPEAKLQIFQVKWKHHLLSEGLFVGLKGEQYFLPLKSLFEALDYSIEIDVKSGTFSGRFSNSGPGIQGDLTSGTLYENGRQIGLDPMNLLWHSNDIYAEAFWLSTWAPFDLEILPFEALIKVFPKTALPLELKLKRLANREKLKNKQAASPSHATRSQDPYRFVDWPFLNVGLHTSFQKQTQPHFQSNFNLHGFGDLGWMTGEFLLSGSGPNNQEKPFDTALVTFHRRDVNANLLGPLKATKVSIGDITTPQRTYAGRSSSGLGFKFSNVPLSNPSEFDRINLGGPLPPGWEVELYRDGTLIAFHQANLDHAYEFPDLPLFYGRNVFKLVFYGPQGQQKEHLRSFNVGQHLIQPGKVYYRFAANRLDRRILPSNEVLGKPTPFRYFAEVEQGLSRNMSWKAHATRLFVNNQWHNYAGGHLRAAFQDLSLFSQVVHDLGTGNLYEIGFQSRLMGLRVNGTHLHFSNFESDLVGTLGLSNKTGLRFQGGVSGKRFGQLAYGFNLNHQRFRNGKKELRIAHHGSLSRRLISLNHQLTWQEVSQPDFPSLAILSGGLATNTTLSGNRIRLRANYSLFPKGKLTRISTDVSRNFGPKLFLRGKATYDFHALQRKKVSLSMTRKFKRLLLSGQFGFADRLGFSANVNFNFQLARHPISRQWHSQPESIPDSMAIATRVFIDENMNQRFDKGEITIKKARFALNQIPIKTETDAHGEAFLKNLPAYIPFEISLIQESIENPWLVPTKRAFNAVGRPGKVLQIDFPLVPSVDIEGFVYRGQGDGKLAISGAQVRLLDKTGVMIADTKTEYDGFFLFEKIAPGTYFLDMDSEQLTKAKVKIPPPQKIEVGEGNQMVESLNIYLDDTSDHGRKNPDEKP